MRYTLIAILLVGIVSCTEAPKEAEPSAQEKAAMEQMEQDLQTIDKETDAILEENAKIEAELDALMKENE